jgi:serine phosphatase RsbU (regulator of sigma subunit)
VQSVAGSAWLIGALVLGGVVYLALAGFVWSNRQAVGARQLIVMLLAVKVWSVSYALELSSRSVEVAQWWSGLKYVGIVVLPPALWSFVLEYTGRGRLSRRVFALLLIHPVVVLTLLAVPATHDLIQSYQEPYGDAPRMLLGAPVPHAGVLFWPHAVYVSTLMLAAVFTLLVRLARIATPYRRQGALLIAASILPCVGNALFNANVFGNIIDPTPFLFLVTGGVLVWGFLRLRGLDLAPVAREIVIEQMSDGVLVLDVYGRVADVNKAGQAILGLSWGQLVGRSAVDVLPGIAQALEKAAVEPDGGTVEDEVLVYPQPIAGQVVSSIARIPGPSPPPEYAPPGPPRPARPPDPPRPPGPPDSSGGALAARPTPTPPARSPLRRLPARPVPGPPRDVAVSLSAVTDPTGRRIARLAVLRDVTDRNRTERQVRELLNEQTRLSETLRQSLRPASLPEVPGLLLAARSVPSARGGGVGGDFYDVHPAGEGRSAFVLGDVSGKGVHAAVVTSMARYTVRTLSAQGWRPREVLRQLNRALLEPDELERFCTVVYGHALPVVEGAGGVRLVLTLGGHPPPLVRRRDRSVGSVGIPGTVLGLLPEVDVHEVTVDLAAGDVLLAYTDGITEARNADGEFGEERLAGVLAGVDAAGRLADDVAEAVLAAVEAFASERDDVALLVLAAV